jgi:hypothetical protein
MARKPTLRQRKAINAVVSGQAKSIAQAMRIAGYSDISALKNPAQLTESQAWKDTIERHGITLDSVARRHGKLLQSKKEEIALRAVDIGYKVNGVYEQNRKSHNTFHAPVQIVINPPNDPQIEPHIEG